MLLCCAADTSHQAQDVEQGAVVGEMALVPYAAPILSRFHEHEQVFVLGGQEVRIAQDWERGGVAAVVWDAVRVTLYMYRLCSYIHCASMKICANVGIIQTFLIVRLVCRRLCWRNIW